jgi:hypothetical protein
VVGLGDTGSHVPAKLASAVGDIDSSNTDQGFPADLHDSELKWQAHQVTSRHTCGTRRTLCAGTSLILSGWLRVHFLVVAHNYEFNVEVIAFSYNISIDKIVFDTGAHAFVCFYSFK